MILHKRGMYPEEDVTFLQIGGGATCYTFLESGSIHATMLLPPLNKVAREIANLKSEICNSSG